MPVTLLAREDLEIGDTCLATPDGVYAYNTARAMERSGTTWVTALQDLKAGQHGPFRETSNPDAIPPMF